MNLVMIDVLPTPWSPKKTSLYFANGDMFGVLEAVPFSAAADMLSCIYFD